MSDHEDIRFRTSLLEENEGPAINPTDNRTMGEIIAARFSRRGFLKGSLAVSAIAVTVSPLIGPEHLICSVRRSLSPFIMPPIITPAVSSLPSAAVATGYVPWRLLASSTRSLVVAANARICLSAAMALTI